MKDSIRKSMRQLRRELSPHQQEQAAQSLQRQFLLQTSLTCCKNVALYQANDGEIDPIYILSYLLSGNQNVFLPSVGNTKSREMEFAPVDSNTEFARNRYGIAEPVTDERISAKSLDLVLLPLVAFVPKGNRIGMGGGFYDRTFAFKTEGRVQRPKLVGLAHELQLVEKLESDSWDIPLDGVLTDQRYLNLSA